MSSKFVSNPSPVQEPLENNNFNIAQEEIQITRWANWLKFISLFGMVESVSTLVYNTLTEVIPTKTRDGLPLYQVYILNIAGFIISYFGYIVSISKSSKIVLNYLVAFVFYIIFQTIIVFSYRKDYISDRCERKEEEDEDCDENLLLVIFIIVFIILLGCVWIPMLYCPLRLYLSTKKLEKILVEEANSEMNDVELLKGILARNVQRK